MYNAQTTGQSVFSRSINQSTRLLELVILVNVSRNHRSEYLFDHSERLGITRHENGRLNKVTLGIIT